MTSTEKLAEVERQPDGMERVAVEGGDVMTYRFGSGDEVLLLANGGPGMPCDYLRDDHSHLADSGWCVVAWDQLGTGRSERPDDDSLWTIERYSREMEQVRGSLGVDKVHVLGQSWGGLLAIEHALRFPDGIKTLTLSSAVADVPHLLSEQRKLCEALGQETVDMMRRREADGSADHPEYLAAAEILSWRHVHRMETIPAALQRSMDGMTEEIYRLMWGEGEFQCTGNLKEWNRLADLAQIALPVLIIVGEHDELTPACSARMHENLPTSSLHVIPYASHSASFEEPEIYFRLLEDFLRNNGGHRGRDHVRAEVD